MKIGVLGGRGHLGKRLIEYGFKSVECDLLDKNSMKSLNGFDVLINCAGKYDLAYCELHPVETAATNVYGLERILESFHGKIIHISCDIFYDGKLGCYSEENNRNYLPFVNTLATSKYFQEFVITKNRTKDYLIVRTSELYDVDTENIKVLLGRIKQERPIAGATDIMFTPTYIPHLVVALRELVEKNIDGIINVAGLTYCTEEKFNEVFCNAGNYSFFYKSGISHRNKEIRQSKRTGLDCQKAGAIGISLFSLEEGIKDLWTKL